MSQNQSALPYPSKEALYVAVMQQIHGYLAGAAKGLSSGVRPLVAIKSTFA